jgi:hypothetical protein
MKDIRRLRLVRFLRVWRRFFAIQQSLGTAIYWDRYPRRLGNGGEAKTVLEYGGEIL